MDAVSAELDDEFLSLKEIWDRRECSLLNTSHAEYHDWFQANSLEVVRNCMLKAVCIITVGHRPKRRLD